MAKIHKPGTIDFNDIDVDEAKIVKRVEEPAFQATGEKPLAIDKQAEEVMGLASSSGITLEQAEETRKAQKIAEDNQLRRKGKIGFWEAAAQDLENKIPFSPAATLKLLDVLFSAQRLQSEGYAAPPLYGRRYGEGVEPATLAFLPRAEPPPTLRPEDIAQWTPASQRQHDVEVVERYIGKLIEREKRGFTFGGKVGAGVSILPAWMLEFALTGGIKKLGTKAARGFLSRATKKELALRTGGWLGGAAARTTIGMPHRVSAAIIERRLVKDPENWATSVALGWGEVFVEAASEEAGTAITKGLAKGVGKLPFGNKFLNTLNRVWVSLSPRNTTMKFWQRVFTKAGYSNLIGEIGEERLATILHSIIGTEDFGAGPESSILERLAAGFSQDIENFPVEATVLAVPGAGRFILGATLGTAGKVVEGKAVEGEAVPAKKEVPLTEMPWRDLQTRAREHGVPSFQARDTLISELERKIELDAMPISQRLGAMTWPELQREARKRGIHAFQQRAKLEEEILLQEGLKDLSPEEQYGGMGWQELQAEARKMGINPFQKRSKVIADMLGKEVAPTKEEKVRAVELAGEILYRGALVGEELTTQEFGVSFTTDTGVVEGYGPEAAEPGEKREVKQYRLLPEAKLYVLTEEDIADIDVDDMNAVGPLIQKFKALGYDAIDMRVFGEGPAEGEIRVLNMDMVQVVEEGETPEQVWERLKKETVATLPEGPGTDAEKLATLPLEELQSLAEKWGIDPAQTKEELSDQILSKLVFGPEKALSDERVEEIARLEREGEFVPKYLRDGITLEPMFTGEALNKIHTAYHYANPKAAEQIRKDGYLKPDPVDGLIHFFDNKEDAEDFGEERMAGFDEEFGKIFVVEIEGSELFFSPDVVGGVVKEKRVYLEAPHIREEGEAPQPAVTEPEPPVKPVPAEEKPPSVPLPETQAWADEARAYLVEEDFEAEEDATPADLVGVLGDYRRLLLELAEQMPSDMSVVQLKEVEDLIRRGELLTGTRDIDPIPGIARDMGLAVSKTPSELLLDAGYWQDQVAQLRDTLKALEGREKDFAGEITDLRALLAYALKEYYDAEEALGENILGEDKTIEGLLKDVEGRKDVPGDRPGTYTDVNPEIQAAAEEMPSYVKEVLSDEDFKKLDSLLRDGIYGPLRDFDLELEKRLDKSNPDVERLLDSIDTILFNSMGWGETAKELEEMGKKDIADQIFDTADELTPYEPETGEEQIEKIYQGFIMDVAMFYEIDEEHFVETAKEMGFDFKEVSDDAILALMEAEAKRRGILDVFEALKEKYGSPLEWDMDDFEGLPGYFDEEGPPGPPTYRGPRSRPGFVLMPWALFNQKEGKDKHDFIFAIKSKMEEKKLNPYDLAKLLEGTGVARRSVDNYMRGKHEPLSEALAKILDVLGLGAPGGTNFLSIISGRLNEIGYTIYDLSQLVKNKIPTATVYTFLSGKKDTKMGNIKIMLDELEKSPRHWHKALGMPAKGKFRFDAAPRTHPEVGKLGTTRKPPPFGRRGRPGFLGLPSFRRKKPTPPTPAEPQPPAGTGLYRAPTQEGLNKTNDDLLAKLAEVKKVRKDEEIPAIKKMRKEQIARALGIQEAVEAEGAPAADVIRRSKGGYKVSADIPQYTPIKLTKKQWDAYSRQVYNVYVGAEYKFQQTAAQDALDKLKDGRLITDAEAALLIPVMGLEVAEQIATTMEKLGDKYQRFWNLARDIVLFWKMPFNFDVQFTRNAVNFLGRHPVKYVKGTYEALRSFASGDYTNTLIQATRGDPAFAEAEAYGMPFLQMGQLAPLGKVPEQFRGRLPYRMSRWGSRRGPIAKGALAGFRKVGRWQLAAERSFVASANWFMLDLWKLRQKQWDASLALLEETGLSIDERERIKVQVDKHKRNHAEVVGNYMKIIQSKSSTGRAIQTAANYVLWSPSMTWSRFRRPEMMMLKPGSRAYAMTIEATSIAKIYAVAMLATVVANYFRDDDDQIETELDPRSSNWGRFKVGDTWFDLGGGEIQHYRTVAQFVVGSIKTQSGRTVEVPRAELAKNYIEGRETALIGIFHEILTGESIFGQKVWAAPDLEELEKEGTVTAEAYAEAWRRSGNIPGGQAAFLTGQWLAEHLMPAALVAFAEASITDGWPQAVAAGLTEAMAMSAQSYKLRASAELALLQNSLAQAYHPSKKWDELSQDEQNDIRTREPALHDIQISVRKEKARWAEPDFDRREALEMEEQLFASLSEAVRNELDSFGLTAGTVGRRFGPTDAPFYLNDKRLTEYMTITKVRVQSALDRLLGSTKYKKMEKKEQELAIQTALSKAKLAAREELTSMIDTGEI